MSLYTEMLADGYKLLTTEEAEWIDIDMQIASMSICRKCGSKMRYEGYVMGNVNTSYRAFAVCNCGHYEEF